MTKEEWNWYKELRKQWEASIIFREYANLLDQGLSRSVAEQKLKERLGINYGIYPTEPVYKKQKLDRDDIVGGRLNE